MTKRSSEAHRGNRSALWAKQWSSLLANEEAERTERTERAALEAANAQLRALLALTDTALSHLALDDLLRELLGRVTDVLGVDHIAIFLLDDDGQTLTMRAARGLLEELVGQECLPLGHGPIGRIAATREPVIVDDVASLDLSGAHSLVREHLRSAVGVPLVVEEQAGVGQQTSRLVGVLAVASATPRQFTEADVQLLQRAADRIALAIGRARLYTAEQDARQRAEAALARAQASEADASARTAHLHTILETMADAVVVYDAAGRPLQMNRAYRALYATERAPAGYASLPARDRLRLLDMRDATTGAPLPFEQTPTSRALRGEVVTGSSAEYRARAFDGRELEVTSSAAALRDGDGRVVGAVLVVHDQTARKQLEREREAVRVQAEQQAEQLDRVFEAVADALVVWDAEGRLARVNAAARRLLGLDAAPPGYSRLPLRERLVHYAARDEQDRPLPPEAWPFVRTLRGEVRTGPEVRDIRMRVLDGREIEAHMSAAPLRDRVGHLVGVVCVLHDRTERNRLAREREAARADELVAREASRRMEQFLAVAAHDLRNPLTATLGFLDLAQRQSERLASAVRAASPALAPPLARQVAAVRDRLEDTDQSATRLARLLTLLFDTAAIRADRLVLRRAPCDVAALVREQVAAQRVAAPGRAIRLHARAGGAPVPVILVEADADRIGQVVANYLTNALKYAPPERPIDVSVRVRHDQARVAVRDRGPGIPAEERARVWELFHRAPGAEAQGRMAGGVQGGSLGLGLYICKAIVEAHGGRVGVESAVGEGSTFWFTLPLAGQ